MSWLHCFWGIGATLGPYIMGFCLTRGLTWNSGYRTISMLQIVLTAILIFSLPLWEKSNSYSWKEENSHKSLSMKEILKIPGAKPALTAFFCYCSLETTTGLWGSSYMVIERGMSAEVAAKWTSLFYLGITFGRFLSGFITTKLDDKNMVRIGQGIAVLGMGCEPIYPSLLHETPDNFPKKLYQEIIGVQMACAYIGSMHSS